MCSLLLISGHCCTIVDEGFPHHTAIYKEEVLLYSSMDGFDNAFEWSRPEIENAARPGKLTVGLSLLALGVQQLSAG